MFQFLRGLDRCGPNFTLGGEAKAIFDLPPKHCKPRRRNGRHLKNLLLALCCVIAGNSETAALTEQPYEIRARLDAAPGNITVTFDGRVIISLHQFYGPAYSVAELGRDGSLKPFPNAQFNDRTERTHGVRLDSVLGIRSDGQGIVWMLDNGLRNWRDRRRLRIIERGVLRTYGTYATPLTAFCAAVLAMPLYGLWLYIGKLFSSVRFLNRI